MSTGTAPGGESITERTQQQAREAAEAAQEKVQEAAGQTKGKLREQLDQRATQVGDQINRQASDLRTVGQSLREQGKEGPAGAADKLADYAEKAGGYLDGKDGEALLADMEDLARRQPWVVGLGALGLGFAASRFLKASSGNRYAARGSGNGYEAPSSGNGATPPSAPVTRSAPSTPPAATGAVGMHTPAAVPATPSMPPAQPVTPRVQP